MIGKDFCLVSGFINGSDGTTPDIYCIDTQNTQANWRKRVSLKDSDSIEGTKLGTGLSHGAEAVVGSKFYMCGGVSDRCAILSAPSSAASDRPLTAISLNFSFLAPILARH